jgi:hypothetical protein
MNTFRFKQLAAKFVALIFNHFERFFSGNQISAEPKTITSFPSFPHVFCLLNSVEFLSSLLQKFLHQTPAKS